MIAENNYQLKIISHDKRRYFKLQFVWREFVGKTIITFHYLYRRSSCSLHHREWKISRRSWNEKQINYCERWRALYLRGIWGSKIRNRPRNQIIRRDNDDAEQQRGRHLSDRLIVDGILDYCECDGGWFFIAWRTSGSVIEISQPFSVRFIWCVSLYFAIKSRDIYKHFNERCIH